MRSRKYRSTCWSFSAEKLLDFPLAMPEFNQIIIVKSSSWSNGGLRHICIVRAGGAARWKRLDSIRYSRIAYRNGVKASRHRRCPQALYHQATRELCRLGKVAG